MTRFSAASVAGIAAGLAFFAHAMVQNSHAWPLLWAFLAGVMTVIIANRRPVAGAGSAVGTGALAGLIAGIVFLLATSIALFGLGIPEEAARELEKQETRAFLGLALAAGVAVIPAAIGAALAHFVFAQKS